MCLGSMQLVKHCDYEIVGCAENRMHGGYGKRELFKMPAYSVVRARV